MFWSKKARLQWLRKEDKNSKYFHVVVNGKRMANRTNQLKKGDESGTKSEKEVAHEIAKYYRQLFTASHSTNKGEQHSWDTLGDSNHNHRTNE